MSKESVTEEAHRIVNGARRNDYGTPLDNNDLTARLWSPILGIEVTAEQVALCMIQVKAARLLHTPHHHDSLVDICGWAQVYSLIGEERERRANAG